MASITNYVLFEEELRQYQNKPKDQDLQRILTSPGSEDLLSWNLFYPASRLESKKEFLRDFFKVCLKGDYDPGSFADEELSKASIILWQPYSDPDEHQHILAEKLRSSKIKSFRERHAKGGRFEGSTKVDISIVTEKSLALVEAKHLEDISSKTSYDLARDQITRNIDVGFHYAKEKGLDFYFVLLTMAYFERQRLFWYKWQDYKTNPQYIRDNIPYMPEEDAKKISRNMGWLLWSDVFALFKKIQFPEAMSKQMDMKRLEEDFIKKGLV